jgi:hypothetical protein
VKFAKVAVAAIATKKFQLVYGRMGFMLRIKTAVPLDL